MAVQLVELAPAHHQHQGRRQQQHDGQRQRGDQRQHRVGAQRAQRRGRQDALDEVQDGGVVRAQQRGHAGRGGGRGAGLDEVVGVVGKG